MESEWTLSDKIEENDEDMIMEFNLPKDEIEWLFARDVREFIKRLKAVLSRVGEGMWGGDTNNGRDFNLKENRHYSLTEILDKLAGDKLI